MSAVNILFQGFIANTLITSSDNLYRMYSTIHRAGRSSKVSTCMHAVHGNYSVQSLTISLLEGRGVKREIRKGGGEYR